MMVLTDYKCACLARNPVECFQLITGDLETAQKLQSLYLKINNIDAVVGLMVEQKDEGAFLPPTAGAIILQEYIRKWNTDRFWYEYEQFTDSQLKEIKSRSISDLMRDNLFTPGLDAASSYDNMFQTPPDTSSYPVCLE